MDTVIQYDIEVIKEEALNLVRKGCLSRQQPIYTLCKYIPDHYWIQFEQELEKNEYLLRDRIIDLLGGERWEEDDN